MVAVAAALPSLVAFVVALALEFPSAPAAGAPPIHLFIFELNVQKAQKKADGGPEVVDVEGGLWKDQKRNDLVFPQLCFGLENYCHLQLQLC